MKVLKKSLGILFFLTLLGCKNNTLNSISKEENSDLKLEKDTSNLPPIILNSSNDDFKFFDEYFIEKINQEVRPFTDLNIVISPKDSLDFFSLVSYEANCGFWSKLYKMDIGGSSKEEYIGIIGADQDIWDSQYYIAIWEKSKSGFQLIDKIESSNSIDSIKFSKEKSSDNSFSINIYFELDQISASSGNGISYWKIQDKKLIKWKKDIQNFDMNWD
ncbi:hypothetical protein [Aureispira anguillae]|uniref:Lipoprotein n=1 Tax=Aureispira anguillae TaxID=2864201 RepID=A0A915YGV0_9BACT|nr:hypothetical protein [Aureispira anguillae]BDS12795.1 hypothetical protein AsAng_0035200 [Aureispira anguillae]